MGREGYIGFSLMSALTHTCHSLHAYSDIGGTDSNPAGRGIPVMRTRIQYAADLTRTQYAADGRDVSGTGNLRIELSLSSVCVTSISPWHKSPQSDGTPQRDSQDRER